MQNCKVWAIDRLNFQSIMMKQALEKQEEYLKFLARYAAAAAAARTRTVKAITKCIVTS